MNVSFHRIRKRLVFALVLIFWIISSVLSPIVIAQTNIYKQLQYPFYDSKTGVCANGELLDSSGELDRGPGDGTIYQSALQPPYILEQFMIHVLKRLSQKYGQPESDFVTEEHVVALVAFAFGEGGDINNQSIFNPMNLGADWPDIKGIPWAGSGDDGRQAYASFDMGVEAYARQMSSGKQSRLGFVLSQPDSTAEQFMYALTYYKKYPGNDFWAAASLPDPAAYYRSRVNLVNLVRKSYPNIAGFVVGTSQLEQQLGIRRTDLLTFTNIAGAGNDSDAIAGDINTCSDTGSSTSGLSIIEVAKREYEKNKGIIEYGGSILDYTDGGQYPWCASFVSWVYRDAGFPLTQGGAGWNHTWVLELQSFMKKYHTYFSVGDQLPQPGDMAFYVGAQTPDGGSTQHMNIVISVDPASNTMVTIGGNESDQIKQTTREISLGSQSLVGFGRY